MRCTAQRRVAAAAEMSERGDDGFASSFPRLVSSFIPSARASERSARGSTDSSLQCLRLQYSLAARSFNRSVANLTMSEERERRNNYVERMSEMGEAEETGPTA